MNLFELLNKLSVKAGATLAGLYIVSQVSIGMLLGHKVGAELIPMQLAFTKTRFDAIVTSWTSENLEQFQHHFYLDFIHPAWYGLTLAWALARTVPDTRKTLVWLPVIAAACDMCENSIHAIAAFTGTFKELDQPWIWMSSTFASTKWLLALGSAVLVVTFFILGRGQKPTR